MLLEPAEVVILRARWRRICNTFISGSYLHGIAAADVRVSGTTERMDIETWCSVRLVEGPGRPTVVVRSQAPGAGVFTTAIDGDDVSVAADIADAIDALRHRRNRVLDSERRVAEQELAEMATSTGWHCDGVSGHMPMTAAFRDALDRVRGTLIRTDRADGDPSAARFAITVDVGALTYAQALGVLAALRGVHAQDQARGSATWRLAG